MPSLNTNNSILSNAINVSSTYNVGIGTASPEGPLHIYKTNAGGYVGIAIQNTGGTTSTSCGIDFGVDASGVYNGTGNAQIKVINTNSSDNRSDMAFSTWSGSVFAERMRITSSGNLGIGTTSPNYALTISGNTDAKSGLRIVNTDSGQTSAARWVVEQYDGKNVQFYVYGGGATFNYTTSGISFYDGTNNATRLLINGRNVGIGTTSPNSLPSGTNLIVRGPTDNPGYIQALSGDGASSVALYSGSYSGDNPSLIFQNSLRFGTATDVATNAYTERMRVASSGELCINTTTITTGRLTLYENGTKWAQYTRHDRVGFQFFSVFLHNTTEIGSITGNNTNTTFATNSDYRLKEDLKDFNGIDLVSKLNVYDFAWKSDNTRRMYGVVAHEMAEILPYAVNKEKDLVKEDGTIDPQGVDYSLITPLLVKAIQELKAEIDILKQQ